MSDSRVFECPSCAAGLRPEGSALQVRCPYCGTWVIVPAALRPPPAPPPPTPPPPLVIQVPPHLSPSYRPPQRARAGGCSTAFSWLFLIVVIGGFAAFAVIMNNDPQFFNRLVAPGPAD